MTIATLERALTREQFLTADERHAKVSAIVEHVAAHGPRPVPEVGYARSYPAPEVATPAPTPEHCSRDPWPASITVPSRTVGSLRKAAEGAGWTVRLTYAKGFRPGPRGKGWESAETIAVRCTRTDGMWCHAFYARRPGAPWRWEGSMMPGGMVGLFTYANSTDTRAWLLARGGLPAEWYSAIEAREKEKVARARASSSGGKAAARESGG